MNKNRTKQLLPGILMAAAISFLIFFYAPVELYCGNLDEFWFDLDVILRMSGAAFLISTFLLTVIYAAALRIHPMLYRIGLAGGLVILICTYIQGNFLISRLPSLDGNAIYWGKYESLRKESILLWIIVLAVVTALWILCKKELFARVISYVSVCLTLMLLVTAVSESVTSGAWTPKDHVQVTTEGEFNMSDDTNFVIFVLDSVDSRDFAERLAAHPEYNEYFSDFTYFQNTTCAYPCTKHSIPYILSGEWYENGEPFEDYVKRVYREASLLQELRQRGYQMGFYEDELHTADPVVTEFDNIRSVDVKVKSYSELAKQELKLIGFRYAPYDLKKYCDVRAAYFDEQLETVTDDPMASFTQNNYTFKTDLENSGITVSEHGKTFRFIHLEGAHVPCIYDKDANVIPFTEGSYSQNVEASATLAHLYIEQLKEAGTYDNTAIVILADHGYNGDVDGNDAAFMRQNAMLLIKGAGERHDTLQISQAPISYADLQEAYVRLLDGADSSEVFDWQEGDSRERRYLWYDYEEDTYMVEYMQTGDAWDMSTMVPTGREYRR